MSDDILRCDMHTHTGFSDDCDVPIADMLAAAYSSGIETLAVTDHYDRGILIPNSRSYRIFRHTMKH